MSKSANTDKKYKGFREFYEDDRFPKKKNIKEAKKDRLQVKQKLRNLQVDTLDEDEFYDDDKLNN